MADTHYDHLTNVLHQKDVRFRARIQSLLEGKNGKFLQAWPSKSWKMGADAFINAVHMRLGLPLLGITGEHYCNCASNALLDRRGDHLLSCALKGLQSERHELLVKIFYKFARYAGLSTSTLTRDLLFEGGDSGMKVDLRIFNPQFLGIEDRQSIMYDVTVVHPTCASNVEGQASNRGYTINKAEVKKKRKYDQLCLREGTTFKPLVFETYGNWSKDVQDLVGHLSTKFSKKSGIAISVVQDHIELELSTKLHSFNAYICLLKNEHAVSRGIPSGLKANHDAILLSEFVRAE